MPLFYGGSGFNLGMWDLSDALPPYTIANPAGGTFLEKTVVKLVPYTDTTATIINLLATTYYQRYVQSAVGVYDITDRSCLAGNTTSDCLYIRYFDPDCILTPLYTSPSECNNISVPIENTDADVKAAYDRGDFSITINGYDAHTDLGYDITSLYQVNGDPIPWSEYVPGKIYLDTEHGVFMFFHYPDKWDTCSSWDFAWWDHSIHPCQADITYTFNSLLKEVTVTHLNHGFINGDIVYVNDAADDGTSTPQPEIDGAHQIIVVDSNTYKYVLSVSISILTPGTARAGVHDCYPYQSNWDDSITLPSWEGRNWDNIDNPIPLNTYWDLVSEAPPASASVVVSYWTKDNADPQANQRSHLYTSPITISTYTQLRFFSYSIELSVEPVKTELYEVGLHLLLDQGLNLVSQPRVLLDPENKLANVFDTSNVRQIFRLSNGLWQSYIPNYYDSMNHFETIDNQHGLFVITNNADNVCIEDGELPVSTDLTLVNTETNQGINAIAVPRRSVADNSIANILDSRSVQYNSIFRVTNGVFESYVPMRSILFNFVPTEMTPGRGYGIVTSQNQVFELPFEN